MRIRSHYSGISTTKGYWYLHFLHDKGLIAVEPDVGGHLSVSYPANRTCYVACYNSIDAGQLVEEGVALGPVKLDYEPGGSTHI